LARLFGLDEILRYSEPCAAFRFGAQKKHLRNPGYPRSSSSFGSGYARLGFPTLPAVPAAKSLCAIAPGNGPATHRL
jgi:hypothetical protein